MQGMIFSITLKSLRRASLAGRSCGADSSLIVRDAAMIEPKFATLAS